METGKIDVVGQNRTEQFNGLRRAVESAHYAVVATGFEADVGHDDGGIGAEGHAVEDRAGLDGRSFGTG